MTDNNALAEALKPCPFCGGKSILRVDDEPTFYVTFEHLRACVMYAVPTDLFPEFLTADKAIAAWNTRQPAPATGEVGEPAAWLYDDGEGNSWLSHRKIDSGKAPYCNETPLYTADILAGHDQWQPIESAPYGIPVKVKIGEGMEMVARLKRDASIDEDGNACDQWQAEFDGEHPENWSDGACWESNSDGDASTQPEAWRCWQ